MICAGIHLKIYYAVKFVYPSRKIRNVLQDFARVYSILYASVIIFLFLNMYQKCYDLLFVYNLSGTY